MAKGTVRHLHRASICEVVFTDTFETGDHKFRYGQAFVDYRSRWGAIIPLRSRTQVGWSFGEFVCRNFAPLILVRDNIAENRGGALMEECHRRGVQSAFICPYTPQQDQAENYLGRVTAMASYAMVYSGAPLRFWIWSTESAAFVSNITATFYSREQAWSTPYTLVYGEPFPDASIVVPFGCGALVLLDKEDREKFQSRCAMLIFIHYATSHPLYTYAFYSPRTKKVLYRQDAIFLVTHFPMRFARAASALPTDRDSFVPLHSPLGFSNPLNDYSFGRWTYGDDLPPYEEHVTGFPLETSPETMRQSPVELPGDWPRRYPHHEAFGPRSTVAVPLPPPYPGSSHEVTDLTPSLSLLPALDMSDTVGCVPVDSPGHPAVSSADDGLDDGDIVQDSALAVSDDVCAIDHLQNSALTVRALDKDMTRGMGHLLRGPNPLRTPLARGQAPNLGPSVLSPIIVTSLDPDPDSSLSHQPPPLPVPSQRVLRDRTKRVSTLPDTSLPSRPTKRKVKNRWFYQPVPALAKTGSAATPTTALTTIGSDTPALALDFDDKRSTPTLLPLCPRAPWMTLDDNRSDEQADKDWRRANTILFGTAGPTTTPAALPSISSDPAGFTAVDPGMEFRGDNMSDEEDTEYQYRHTATGIDLLGYGPDGSLRSSSHYPSPPHTDASAPSLRFRANRDGEFDFYTHLTSSPRFHLLSEAAADTVPRRNASPPFLEMFDYPPATCPYINSKTVRRILAARESIFKYSVYLSRNDRDADASPEKVRGRQLEWLRLKAVGAFEYDWTKERLTREFPHYPFSDICFLFYIYDYKFTGEHRVRLVFDGSRQSPSTYDDTFSPTVRPESIRLFHIYCVEMGWELRQYDVPQAFLQSPVDHDIFVHPPRSNVEFPGQLLKLRLALYGAKQSSALFFKLLNSFLLTLGFQSSTLNPCFYRRSDALLILHVDDMRCAGTPNALLSIHAALSERFNITTGDGTRFLGMDTKYDINLGLLTFSMETYIETFWFESTWKCHFPLVLQLLGDRHARHPIQTRQNTSFFNSFCNVDTDITPSFLNFLEIGFHFEESFSRVQEEVAVRLCPPRRWRPVATQQWNFSIRYK